MLYQIEMTTHCNYKCLYCPIETIENNHMKDTVFYNIVDKLLPNSHIRMQGTGEPFLHPKLYEFVHYLKTKGHYIDIVTNGSIPIDKKFLDVFDRIGFSIDTLDKELSYKTGRIYLEKTLKNLENLNLIQKDKVMIWSVNYGQNLKPLISYSKENNIPLSIQNLQTKTIYQKKYKTQKKGYKRLSCLYIKKPVMEYYFVDGTIAPCCYMIDKNLVIPKEKIKAYFSKRLLPKCCEQCNELTK